MQGDLICKFWPEEYALEIWLKLCPGLFEEKREHMNIVEI